MGRAVRGGRARLGRGVTVVVGTAGHIDHGKTTLLRALTGIDADRLPEERRRGMTIDVGYAHLALDDGRVIDFVDVPGHDRLVGNMLVGAGEIDAVMLVVAADDGARAQTREHLALVDALGIAPGIAVITKIDAVGEHRVAEVRDAVARLLDGTSLAGSPVIAASGMTGDGLDAVRAALAALAAAVVLRPRAATLAIDRVFTVKGRGTVVTGTLRGGPLATGDRLRVVPGDGEVRVREIQVRGARVEVANGGRTALNLAGVEPDTLHRGVLLTVDPTVVATDRVLAVFRGPVADRVRGRVHVGTAAVEATIGRAGRDALVLADGRPAGTVRLQAPVAARPGDRFVLRRGPDLAPVGGVILDPEPARGVSRRRQTADRVDALARAIDTGGADEAWRTARRDLHGAVVEAGRVALAPDVAESMATMAVEATGEGIAIAALRARLAPALRRSVTLRRDSAAAAAASILERLVADGRLVRDGELVRRPGVVAPAGPDPALDAAMARLEAALDTAAPPALSEAARAAACPPEGIRLLERTARIVVLEPELAYAMSTYRDLAARALAMAARGPLTPAAFRDATGTSRKYVMAILEDLDRKALLRRTPDGHVPGPKAPAAVRAATPTR